MAVLLQLRRGTTAENDLFTGALAEATYDTERKELRVHDGSTQGGKIVSVPTGLIASFGGTVAPEGWLVCDGSAISRTNYADLFAKIGTTYGDGDGSLTFNLPDISDCFVQGGVPGVSHVAGLPNITGSFTCSAAPYFSISASGAFAQTHSGSATDSGSGGQNGTISIDASRSSAVYGASSTVQPKSVEVLYCIKY